VVRAQFVQERLITDMTRPTLSRGASRSRAATAAVADRIAGAPRARLHATAIIETGPDGVRRLRAQGRSVDAQVGA
jgi:hypothetical protein